MMNDIIEAMERLNSKKQIEESEVISKEVKSREGELENYLINLQKNGFDITDNKLVYRTKNDYKPISNFIPVITKKIKRTNGIDTEIRYKIKAIVLDEENLELPELEITVEELKTFNFTVGSSWDGEAIIEGGTSNGNKLRQVAQILSRKRIETETIFEYTGMQKIQGKTVYLYEGGSIGEVKNVKADLSRDKLEQYCFTDKKFDSKTAISTSFSISNLSTPDIAIPLLATTYLSPIVSILQEEGIKTDYVLVITGKTGVRKSSIASLMISHYGIFDRNRFCCSFRDTINNLEKKAYILKDTLNVIDDLNPETFGTAKIEVLEELSGMYGDRVGRGRMQPNGKELRNPYIARGNCIITGEFLPRLPQGRLARCIVINVRKDSFDLNKLTVLQENKEQLAFAMMKYIEWIIANENAIREFARKEIKDLRNSQNNQIHGRTNDSVNVMYLGYSLLLKFLLDYKVIGTNQIEELKKEAYTILLNIANKQEETTTDTDPINMFYKAIYELEATEKIYLIDYKTGYPLNENPKGRKVGYLDKEKNQYYFFPETIYAEICKFYAGQECKFPLSKLSLLKYLQEEDLLFMTDPSRKTVKRTDPKTKQKIEVIAVKIREDKDTGQE